MGINIICGGYPEPPTLAGVSNIGGSHVHRSPQKKFFLSFCFLEESFYIFAVQYYSSLGNQKREKTSDCNLK